MRVLSYGALAGFAATIPAANWLIHNAGTVCVPDGPCLIPVAPGLMAPSGVLMIGLALVLRDVVHEKLGTILALAAILLGAVLSGAVAPPALVIASAAAFLLSELADMTVYAPLRRRNLVGAVVLSGVVGAAVDSVLFLYLAFGSLDFWAGQMVGKMWAVVFAVPVLLAIKRYSTNPTTSAA